MEERWKPVRGFESYYEVSDYGRVISLTVRREHGGYRPRTIPGRMLKGRRKRRALQLYGDPGQIREVRIAVLVAEHFVPNPEKLPLVCHKDDDQTNDHYKNLYWGTHESNTADAARNDRLGRKLSLDEVAEIRRLIVENKRGLGTGKGRAGGLYSYIAAQFGVSTTTICRIKDGKTWFHV